jgi:hypothetical protein
MLDGERVSTSGFNWNSSSFPLSRHFPTAGLTAGVDHTLYVSYQSTGSSVSYSSPVATFRVNQNALPTPVLTINIDKDPLPNDQYATATISATLCGSNCGYGSLLLNNATFKSFAFDANGQASVVFGPIPNTGTYTLSAQSEGNASYSNATSNSRSFTVALDTYPQPIITATVDPSVIPLGQPALVTITTNCGSNCGSGHLIIDEGYAGGFYLDNTGSASLYMTSLAGLPQGHHELKISYFGDIGHAPIIAGPFGFDVTTNVPPSPVLTVTPSQTTLQAGTLSSALVEANCGSSCGSPVSGQLEINGQYAGGYQLDSTGKRTVNFYAPSTPGTYQLTARFFGNITAGAATSPAKTLTVQ